MGSVTEVKRTGERLKTDAQVSEPSTENQGRHKKSLLVIFWSSVEPVPSSYNLVPIAVLKLSSHPLPPTSAWPRYIKTQK